MHLPVCGNQEPTICQFDDMRVALLRYLEVGGRYRQAPFVRDEDPSVLGFPAHTPDLALVLFGNVLAILPSTFAVGTLQVHRALGDGRRARRRVRLSVTSRYRAQNRGNSKDDNFP